MPTSNQRSIKKSTRAKKSATPISQGPRPSVPNVCRSCHSLPAGSMELMALMLVLVFSLSAVLFTSVYALTLERVENSPQVQAAA